MEETLTVSEQQTHERWMRLAIDEAKKAEEKGEVPIGAVLVKDGQVVARGHNVRETLHTAIGHAEMMAIQSANQVLGAWRLTDTTLYVTLEPCPMCAGAIIMSRITCVVFGSRDMKAGCVGSVVDLLSDERFNHQPHVISGILESECSDLLTNFFRQLRRRKRAEKQATSILSEDAPKQEI